MEQTAGPSGTHRLCFRAVRNAARAGLIAPPLFVLVWILAGLIDPHFSFLTGHGSDLAKGSAGWLMTLNFIVAGLLEVLFAVALLAGKSRVVGVLVLVVGLGLAGSGLFPEDFQGRAATAAGSVHNALFPVVFLAIVLAAVYSAIRAGGGWRVYSILTALVVVGGTLGFLIAGSEPGDPLYGVSGVIELLLTVVAFAWLTLLAAGAVGAPIWGRPGAITTASDQASR